MQTTYRLNTQELNLAFLKSIKSLLPNREVEITVSTLPKSNQIENQEWLYATANNPSFDFLNDEAENIYSLSDGNPLENEK